MDDALTPERQQAQATFHHAIEQFHRGKVEDAFEIAETSLEYDTGFVEARRWLAQQYEVVGEGHKASRHLQVIVHHHHDDLEAWAALDRVDPKAAERIRRATELPPDPFMTQRHKPVADFGDLETMDEIMEEGVEPEFVEERLIAAEGDTDLDEIEDVPIDEETITLERITDLSDILDDEVPGGEAQSYDPTVDLDDDRPAPKDFQVAEVVAAPAAPAPLTPSPRSADGPQPWEHEQDRQYRDLMLQNALLAPVIHRILESWKDPDAWGSVLAECAHASKHTHAEIYEAAHKACEVLGGPEPSLLLAPEGSPHCVPLRAHESEVVVNTGLLRTISGAQLLFAIARVLAVHRSGHAPYFDTTLMVTDRSGRLLGACEEAIKEYLWDLMGSWFESHPKLDRAAAGELAHAWHLRGELSCDRAGLLACADLDAACNAIAKTCRHTGAEAQHTDCEGMLAKHASDDVGQLAAIPMTEDPRYNEGYAVYRIQMLRWWATTDDYRALAAKLRPA
jgi:hypothetical protein